MFKADTIKLANAVQLGGMAYQSFNSEKFEIIRINQVEFMIVCKRTASSVMVTIYNIISYTVDKETEKAIMESAQKKMAAPDRSIADLSGRDPYEKAPKKS